jgi:16S rRNA (cytosine1402-N4)-methyltransferase
LNIKPDGVYVDCTFGRGGHARAVLERLGPDGRLLALDRDPQAVEAAHELAEQDERFSIQRGSFTMLKALVEDNDLLGKVDGLLLDLGVSSPQLDDPERGFSFQYDGPLDMRMDNESGQSAAEWLAEATEREISQVLFDYGEERHGKRIARAICKAREETPITTTAQLVEIISAANPSHEKHKHPATRSFQAIRIFINRELEELHDVLGQVLEVLAVGGRLVVISFHSLEDRIVKRFIRKQVRGDDLPRDLPVTADMLNPRMRAIGKAIYADKTELVVNPRAGSAVLRIAERL